MWEGFVATTFLKHVIEKIKLDKPKSANHWKEEIYMDLIASDFFYTHNTLHWICFQHIQTTFTEKHLMNLYYIIPFYDYK
jgi:hypothetical protein